MNRRSVPAFAAALLAAAALIAGCAADTPEQPAADLAHVHGLAFDGSDTVIAATHAGLYRIDLARPGQDPEGPIGGLDIDAMGFTVTGDVAYASGHPGPDTPAGFGSPNLGLIRSHDLGESWENVSLTGETDFHDLAVSAAQPERIYGLEGDVVRRSDDGGVTWTQGATVQARDLLSPAHDAELVYATTPDGLLLSRDAGRTFAAEPGAPGLYLITDGGEGPGSLAGIDAAGTVWTRDADGGSWVRGGSVTGTPQAMTVLAAGGRLVVADDRGLSYSDDAGATWTAITR